MPDASDSIRQIVKMADYIEALLFLSDELNMGNGRINDVYSDVLKNAEEVWEQFEWYSEIGAEKPKIAQILNKLNQAIDGANAV